MLILDRRVKVIHCIIMSHLTTTVTLKKWGNSLGLLLPAPVVKAIHLGSGTKVEIEVSEDSIVIRKASGQSKIEEMCAAITAGNIHPGTEWGSPRGNEAW